MEEIEKKEKKTTSRTKKEKNPTFEEALGRIEEIASLLEGSNPPLGEALELYEESARLIKFCTKQLDEAQAKITVLEKGAN